MSEKSESTANRGAPPPLPPRLPPRPSSNHLSPQSSYHGAPPAYESIFADSARDGIASLAANDPRTSSTQSLVPTKSNQDQGWDKRRLLLIFIHGFMGDETSFQSFPAHVHSLTAALVAETHVVHTKIYPRYRSKKNIQFARDDFSRWLTPHEAPMTDVVLLGHSMGGLLSAEVALSQTPSERCLRHRVLGTINFDVPFLGMHPSVIKSGLSSIFAPAAESPKPQAEASSSSYMTPGTATPESENASTASLASPPPALPPRRTDTLFNAHSVDPNYNPAFENDVRLPVRKGWRNAWHFISKHNQDLIDATKQLVKSHLEFGGAMADYSGLKNRYCRIRALEEMDANMRKSIVGTWDNPPRVRFVNYYTSSTGRPRKPKSNSASPALTPTITPAQRSAVPSDDKVPTLAALSAVSGDQPAEEPPLAPSAEVVPSGTESPMLKVEDCDREDEEIAYDLEESNMALDDAMDHLNPEPMSDNASDTSDAQSWADAVQDLDVRDTESALDDGIIVDSKTDDVKQVDDHVLQHDDHVKNHDIQSLPSDGPGENESTNGPSTSVTLAASSVNESSLSLSSILSFPPIPEPPVRPPEPDYSVYIDKETRKLAEKDYSRALKTYDRAVKDRHRAIRDREKLEEKRQRNVLKESKRAERDGQKEVKRKEKETEREAMNKEKVAENSHERVFELQRRETEREWKETLAMKWNDEDGTVTPMPSSSASALSPALTPATSLTTAPSLSSFQTTIESRNEAEKPRKERTFCTVPPKDSSGNRDPVWVKVFMPNVDEVGAHCGLFFETSPAYEQLVGDVGERIAEWVNEDVSARFAEDIGDN